MNEIPPLLRSVHLKPGELLLTQEELEVVTLLGSCVAVTLYCARPHFAGICHAMLARPGRNADELSAASRFKYLSEAIPHMAARFRNMGIPATAIEVKMFGGGNVTATKFYAQEHRNLIGTVNVETACALLEQESLLLKASNVGDLYGRKLIFNTLTGEVRHKHLPRHNLEERS